MDITSPRSKGGSRSQPSENCGSGFDFLYFSIRASLWAFKGCAHDFWNTGILTPFYPNLMPNKTYANSGEKKNHYMQSTTPDL